MSDDVDLAGLAFWARPPEERLAAFARLRARGAPVFFRERRIPLVRARLPVAAGSRMMGVPDHLHPRVAACVDAMTEYSGVRGDVMRLHTLRLFVRNVRAIVTLHRLVARLGRERRADPGDDLISALVNADIAGERLPARAPG